MKKIISILFIAFSLLSCEQGGINEHQKPVNESILTFYDGTDFNPTIGSKGGKITYSFTTNCKWDVSINDNWLKVSSTTGGAGNKTLTVTIDENKTGEERFSQITISYGGGKSIKINLTQKANAVFQTDGGDGYIVEADGGTVDVKVTTNLEYDVIIPDEASFWINVADTRATREETLTFTIEENKTSDERKTTVTLKDSNGDTLQNLTFRQKGVEEKVFSIDSESNYNVSANGSIIEVDVITNIDYYIEIPEDVQEWVSIADTRAIRNETLIIVIAKNESDYNRKATISIKGEDHEVLQMINITQYKLPTPNQMIIYTTKNNEPIDINVIDGFGAKVLLHTFENGIGNIMFDGDIVNIPDKSFYNQDTILSLQIPDSVTNIGSQALYGCKSLKSITIPNSVMSIGDYAFYNCQCELIVDCNLENKPSSNKVFNGATFNHVTLGPNVVMIGDYAFKDCVIQNTITLPNHISSIGYRAFEGCTGELIVACDILDEAFRDAAFNKVTICDGVTTIGESAFSGCSSLTSITIPDSVTEIGKNAFHSCDNLSNIIIPQSVTVIGDGAFCMSDLRSITIPDSVISIGNKAFYYCQSLSNVSIGENVEKIGDSAFYHCDFTNVNIPDSVASIGNDTFSFCANLEKVTLGRGITSIGDRTFYYCENLTDINIPNGVKSIGEGAFYNCKNLTDIYIPNGVKSIGEDAFYNCVKLYQLTLPQSVTDIGQGAFAACKGLTNVTLSENITAINEGLFLGCSNLSSITIPDSVTTIEYNAFNGCSKLNSIYLGDGIASIGNAFMGCTNLNKISIPSLSQWCKIDFEYNPLGIAHNLYIKNQLITDLLIPEDIYEIKEHAFYGCHNIQSVTMPDSVTSIGEEAFYNCTNLTDVIIGNGVTSIYDRAFEQNHNLTEITIGEGVTYIGEDVFYGCDKLVKINISDLTSWCKINFVDAWSNPLSGWVGQGSSELYINGNLVTDLLVPDEVSEIKQYAFSGCSSIKSVTIPDNIIVLGEYAFNGCTGLEGVSIGNGVTRISKRAFNYCSSLKNIDIPYGVTSIGEGAFVDCTSLSSLYLPNSITSIGDQAFYYCTALKYIYCKAVIPPIIGNSVFSVNASGRTIYVPSGSVDTYKTADGWQKYSDYIVGYDF